MTTITIRHEQAPDERVARLRAQGHATDRPGDRLHRYFAGEPQDGDKTFHRQLLTAVAAHKGDVPAIAKALGVGVRTLRRWMAAYPDVAQLIYDAKPAAEPLTHKRCGRCKETLPVERFTRRRNGSPVSWCRSCRKFYMGEWKAGKRRANPATYA